MGEQQTSIVDGRFDDRVAIVTGAASGMGRATARRIVAEGGSVFGIDTNAEGLETLAAELGDPFGWSVSDIREASQCQAAVDGCVEAFGRLDVLANVAGVLRMGHFTELDDDAVDLVWGVNVRGTYNMARAAVPHLLEVRGNIVNVASSAGLMGQAYAVAYCASKGAVIQLTKALAMEYAKSPLRVNCVAPGGTNTAMTGSAALPADADFKIIANAMGFRRMSEPEEIAAVICFLAGPEASSIHGAVVAVDAGLTAA